MQRTSYSLCVQSSSEAHPASYPVGTGGPFPGVKSGRAWRSPLTTSNAEVKNEYKLYTSSPPWHLHGVAGQICLLPFYFWLLTSCGHLHRYQHLRITCCLHLQPWIPTVSPFETIVSAYKTTWLYKPEDEHRHFHRYENIISQINNFFQCSPCHWGTF
jgi:hypothetical protein